MQAHPAVPFVRLTRARCATGFATTLLVAALASGCAGLDDSSGGRSAAVARPAPPQRRAVIVSIDGLLPAAYTDPDAHGLRVPHLRAMVASGASAAGARSVLPAVTYPAHTTIATGVPPSRHGITGNRPLDPLERNQGGWFWYAEDIRAPTIWDAARERGLAVSLVSWPVTVGARVRDLVPEIWRAGTTDDQKLLRALSTPGLLDRVQTRFPDLWRQMSPPNVTDEASIDVAVHLLDTSPPDLLLVHIWQVDDAEHGNGPWSVEARAAIENADRQLGRLIAACQRRGIWTEDTALFVVSDHGFASVHTEVRLGQALADRGLLRRDAAGKPVEWRAAVQSNGGTAYVFLADPGDVAAERVVREVLAELAAGPDRVVARILEPKDVRRAGGDPRALLAVEAAPGITFADGPGPLRRAAGSIGQHGHPPDRPDMRASFLVTGPGVTRVRLGEVSLEDVAPTVAAWLGVPLPTAAGRALPVFRAPVDRARE